MRKTTDYGEVTTKIAVPDRELASMMGIGVDSARRFSKEAGARFYIGKRPLNDLSIIQEHMRKLCKGE